MKRAEGDRLWATGCGLQAAGYRLRGCGATGVGLQAAGLQAQGYGLQGWVLGMELVTRRP